MCLVPICYILFIVGNCSVMSVPKIFVSSTCYDLNEVRMMIHETIRNFGYEPIMSEFDDIFYSPDAHVQDACISAINSCDMFIMIIGDKYGSTYHKNNVNTTIPSSVTLEEFGKAISLNIPKIIFLNKLIHYDYNNYCRFLAQYYIDYFSQHPNNDNNSEIKNEIRINFDATYPFPKSEYRYIFYFLDKIKELSTGNAYHEFENSKDIQKILIKQWAGYMTKSLQSFKKNSSQNLLEKHIDDKISKLEALITTLVNGISKSEDNKNNKLDLTRLLEVVNYNQLEELQKVVDEAITNILYTYDGYWNNEHFQEPRVKFCPDYLTEDYIKSWMNELKNIFNTYKWSNSVNINIVFKQFTYQVVNSDENPDSKLIPIKYIGVLAKLYEDNKAAEQNNLIKTIQLKFEELGDKRIPPF